jgi:phosphomannomutase|tara:strand:- start:338 stop:1054 length:717 start_codon:yes stop_codon:yes gene_type:complete
MNHFIFDVDGTLTPSRKKINPQFALWFLYFSQNNTVSLVTGSDNPKTLEQIGPEICMSVNKIYNCNGNDVWYRQENVYTNPWKMTDELKEFLNAELKNSEYTIKTGKHLEERPGMVNFSVVGRNADKVQRKDYFYYDIEADERIHIAERINKHFPNVSAVVGGETGIDIIAKGKDKRQVLQEIQKDRVFFFGDRMDPDGNDFSLAYAVKEAGGVAKQVKSWRDTKEILENFQQRGIAN